MPSPEELNNLNFDATTVVPSTTEDEAAESPPKRKAGRPGKKIDPAKAAATAEYKTLYAGYIELCRLSREKERELKADVALAVTQKRENMAQWDLHIATKRQTLAQFRTIEKPVMPVKP